MGWPDAYLVLDHAREREEHRQGNDHCGDARVGLKELLVYGWRNGSPLLKVLRSPADGMNRSPPQGPHHRQRHLPLHRLDAAPCTLYDVRLC